MSWGMRDYCGLTVAGGTALGGKGVCQGYRLSGAVKGSPFIINKQDRASAVQQNVCGDGAGPNTGRREHSTHRALPQRPPEIAMC